ncbi:hypothetical protein SAMN05444172_4684 [Burkholderia sp. GAS332]|nr:hypothetical protein SAMN05444172_4684 [Burkholderia sp. GAS332]
MCRCALCLRDVQLQESHIFPEFLYEPLYDQKHRLQILSADPDLPNVLKQKGLKERLLCNACEQRFSIWEGYARQFIRGELPLTITGQGSLIYMEGVDYRKFRLFQLSIIWRAGVSKLQFFEHIMLGPHEERLRTLLINGDPSSPDRYACFMFAIQHESGLVLDEIFQPIRQRALGQIVYSFIFGGFHWAYLVSNQDVPAHLKSATLRENGTIIILKRSISTRKDLKEFYNRLADLGRLE